MLYNINTFECAVTPTEKTAEVSHFWSARNAQIAKNIAEAVAANGTEKNLVVIGAGHVMSLKAELERQYPDIKVKLLSDLSGFPVLLLCPSHLRTTGKGAIFYP